MQQRAEEHDDGAGTAGRVGVDRLHVQLGGGHDLQVHAVVDPAGAHPDGVQHLQQPEDLLDPGHAAQDRTALVEQRTAEQRHTGVLARLDVDGAGRSRRPPTTRRCIGPAYPSDTISLSSASPMRAIISRLMFWLPRSMRFTALWLVASASASWVWVQPLCCRATRMSLPMRAR